MRKISVGESFAVAVFSGTEKFGYEAGGGAVEYQDFLSTFFVSQCRKYSQVNPSLLFFRKFQEAKKIMDKTGSIKIFRGKFFVSQCRKTS